MNKVTLIIVTLILAVAVGFGGCVTSETPETTPSEPSYVESQFTVSKDTVYRLNIFASEGDTITGYWKADSALYSWYTNPFGIPDPLHDYGIGPQGERVIGVREPGRIGDAPTLRIVDAKGSYLRDEQMGGSSGGKFEIEATEGGYYSLCFMPCYEDSVEVILQYRVTE